MSEWLNFQTYRFYSSNLQHPSNIHQETEFLFSPVKLRVQTRDQAAFTAHVLSGQQMAPYTANLDWNIMFNSEKAQNMPSFFDMFTHEKLLVAAPAPQNIWLGPSFSSSPGKPYASTWHTTTWHTTPLQASHKE